MKLMYFNTFRKLIFDFKSIKGPGQVRTSRGHHSVTESPVVALGLRPDGLASATGELTDAPIRPVTPNLGATPSVCHHSARCTPVESC